MRFRRLLESRIRFIQHSIRHRIGQAVLPLKRPTGTTVHVFYGVRRNVGIVLDVRHLSAAKVRS